MWAKTAPGGQTSGSREAEGSTVVPLTFITPVPTTACDPSKEFRNRSLNGWRGPDRAHARCRSPRSRNGPPRPIHAAPRPCRSAQQSARTGCASICSVKIDDFDLERLEAIRRLRFSRIFKKQYVNIKKSYKKGTDLASNIGCYLFYDLMYKLSIHHNFFAMFHISAPKQNLGSKLQF